MKDKEVAQDKHEHAADQVGPARIGLSEMELLKSPQGQPENQKIVDHIEKNVVGHIRLGLPNIQIVHFDDFGKGLRNADGTGEFNDVYRKCQSDHSESRQPRER